jgi:hypothetical protein
LEGEGSVFLLGQAEWRKREAIIATIPSRCSLSVGHRLDLGKLHDFMAKSSSTLDECFGLDTLCTELRLYFILSTTIYHTPLC